MKRLFTIVASVVLVIGLAPLPSRAATVQVFMSNLRFCNAPVCTGNQNTTIKRGDVVQWVYTDAQCTALAALGCHHTVNAPTFNSGQLGVTSGTLVFERAFTSTGSFPYTCQVHLAMGATITVTP